MMYRENDKVKFSVGSHLSAEQTERYARMYGLDEFIYSTDREPNQKVMANVGATVIGSLDLGYEQGYFVEFGGEYKIYVLRESELTPFKEPRGTYRLYDRVAINTNADKWWEKFREDADKLDTHLDSYVASYDCTGSELNSYTQDCVPMYWSSYCTLKEGQIGRTLGQFLDTDLNSIVYIFQALDNNTCFPVPEQYLSPAWEYEKYHEFNSQMPEGCVTLNQERILTTYNNGWADCFHMDNYTLTSAGRHIVMLKRDFLQFDWCNSTHKILRYIPKRSPLVPMYEIGDVGFYKVFDEDDHSVELGYVSLRKEFIEEYKEEWPSTIVR